MRTFYIYNVNNYIKNIYFDYPYKLYKLIENTYYTNKINPIDGTATYTQILIPFDKTEVNNILKKSYKLENYYCNKANMHVISSNYEYSKLNVNAYLLKIKTNKDCPIFFNNLSLISTNLFICDFENRDFFWLEKINRFDRQNNSFIVK